MKTLKNTLYISVFFMACNLTAQEPAQENQPANQNAVSIENRMNSAPNIGLSAATRQDIALMLNNLLADEFILYTKTLNYHWNVVGPFFGDLHGFFNKLYVQLQGFMDLTAERVRALGYRADSTAKTLSSASILLEEPKKLLASRTMLQNLLADHESIIKSIRSGIDMTAKVNDMGTNNFLCDLIMKYEKNAWMLRSYLIKE